MRVKFPVFVALGLAAFAAGWLANERRLASRLEEVQQADAMAIAAFAARLREAEAANERLRQEVAKRETPAAAKAEGAADAIFLPRHLLRSLQIWPALTAAHEINDDLVEVLRLTDKERAESEAALRQTWHEIVAAEAKKVVAMETNAEKAVLSIAPFAEDGAAIRLRLQARLAEIMGQRRAEDFFAIAGEQFDRHYLAFGRHGRLISISLRRRGTQTLYEIIEEKQETAASRQPMSGRLVPSLPPEWQRYAKWLPPALRQGLPPGAPLPEPKDGSTPLPEKMP